MLYPDNHGRYIQSAIDRTHCKKHGVDKGTACFTLDAVGGQLLLGICNRRIRLAGFTGKISPGSMRRNAPVKLPVRVVRAQPNK